MKKKEKSKLEYIGYILIIVGVIIIVIHLIVAFIEKFNVNNEIDDYIDSSSNLSHSDVATVVDDEILVDKIVIVDEKETFLVLEIPSINFMKNIYNFDSKYNSVKYNIEILDASDTPDVLNGNVVLAAHNGNSKVSFFNKLYKLNIGDEIYIYYNGIKYIYKLSKVYDIKKDGIAEIYRDKNQSSISLITCKKNTKDKQEVYIGYLYNTYEY